VTLDKVTPRKIGYFNKKRNWNLIVDLNDEKDLRKMQFLTVIIEDGLRIKDTITNSIIFGLKYSKIVKQSELKTSDSIE
jgi:hypothetical protein